MRAVFNRELKLSFTSVSGPIFGFFFLLFMGIYTVNYCIMGQSSNFEYVPPTMSYVLLITIPVLTMRIFPEEKSQHCDKLLYSLPLSMTEVVWGKYLAQLVLFLIPMMISGIYPFVLSAYGDVYIKGCFWVFVGLFLLTSALIAIGMFISATVFNQTIAAALTLIVMLLIYFMNTLCEQILTSSITSLSIMLMIIAICTIALWFLLRMITPCLILGVGASIVSIIEYSQNPDSFEGIIPRTVKFLSPFERFYEIAYGSLDLLSLAYMLLLGTVFVFLTIVVMERRRWN